jgi:hypothetical protein
MSQSISVHRRMTSHASSRHGSESWMKKSVSDAQNTRTRLPSVAASSGAFLFHFGGSPHVFVRVTAEKSRPMRFVTIASA